MPIESTIARAQDLAAAARDARKRRGAARVTIGCVHRGARAGAVPCLPCRAKTGLSISLPTYACAVHGTCTMDRAVEGVACCEGCADKSPPPTPDLLPGLPDPLAVTAGGNGWHQLPEVQAGHIKALRYLAAQEIPPPAQAEGDGVVIVGGGRYWLMAVLAARMTRDVSALPIQIWHRGAAEPVDLGDVADLPDVAVIDVTRYPHRRMGGWEAKSVALLNCGFERVLYFDADAYPVSNPAPFLALATAERPFAFWQDQPSHEKDVKWNAYGVAGKDQPTVQGGQLAIHRAAGWRTLLIAHWLNQHSDYFYGHSFGDQDQWRAALAVTGQGYHCLGHAPWVNPAFVCEAAGTVIIHRCKAKVWGKGDDVRAADLPGEDRYWAHRAAWLAPPGDAAAVFGRAYRLGLWGHGEASGGGSTEREAAPYLELVWALAKVGRWREVVDLACGDGAITRRLQERAIRYVAAVDCYAPHLERLRPAVPTVQWHALDIDRDRDQLPKADAALLKDVLHHWPTALVREWLAWAKAAGKWRWLVVTYDVQHAQVGADCPLGGYRPLSADLAPLAGLGLVRVARYLHKEVALLDCGA